MKVCVKANGHLNMLDWMWPYGVLILILFWIECGNPFSSSGNCLVQRLNRPNWSSSSEGVLCSVILLLEINMRSFHYLIVCAYSICSGNKVKKEIWMWRTVCVIVNYCNLGTYQEHELQQRKNFKLASYTVRLAVEDLFNSVIRKNCWEAIQARNNDAYDIGYGPLWSNGCIQSRLIIWSDCLNEFQSDLECQQRMERNTYSQKGKYHQEKIVGSNESKPI